MGVMLTDRIAMLYRSTRVKLVLHIITVVFIHLLMFFILPLSSGECSTDAQYVLVVSPHTVNSPQAVPSVRTPVASSFTSCGCSTLPSLPTS